MVHVHALPGTPASTHPVSRIADDAASEAMVLAQAGFDAIIVENMHDVPYLRREVGPEIVAAMTAATAAITRAVAVPVGVQVLAGANRAAVAVAHAAGAAFVRAEGFVFSAVADEGLLDEADAGPLLRHRRAIGADGVAIFADIRKKHGSHAITADLTLSDNAKAAAFFGADGVVVTGATTGDPTPIDSLREARDAADIPVLAGSGANERNVKDLLTVADAVIVGSSIKLDGNWRNAVDATRARRFVDVARS